MTIFLEAIQRFVEPQEVQNPKLVLIVGCLGLASNIVGLVLFHDHSHGGHGHDHGHGHIGTADEEQLYIGSGQDGTAAVSDERGAAVGAMPANALETGDSQAVRHIAGPDSPRRSIVGRRYSHRRGSRRLSASERSYRDVNEIYTHPANLRQDIIDASRFEDEYLEDENPLNGATQPSEQSPLLRQDDRNKGYASPGNSSSNNAGKGHKRDLHHTHNHAQPNPEKKTGHSHDLNMRGVFLHVLGDALGNIGVIASALIIWLTKYSWRYYSDPAISLAITVIILCSAIPLCKAASRILLQAAPAGMSVDHIIEDIESLPGIISCHHLHVWQLNNTNLVSSLHIQVSHDIKDEGSDRYMELARQVRLCLHAYGIHSSTIQPEFSPSSDSNSIASSSGTPAGAVGVGTISPHTGDDSPCLLDCGNECSPGGQCCPST